MFFGTFVVLQTTHTYLCIYYVISVFVYYVAKYLKGSIVNSHYAIISLSFANAFECYTALCILLQFLPKRLLLLLVNNFEKLFCNYLLIAIQNVIAEA